MIIDAQYGDRVVCRPPARRLAIKPWLQDFLNKEGMVTYVLSFGTVSVLFDNYINDYRTWELQPIDLEYLDNSKLESMKRHFHALKFL